MSEPASAAFGAAGASARCCAASSVSQHTRPGTAPGEARSSRTDGKLAGGPMLYAYSWPGTAQGRVGRDTEFYGMGRAKLIHRDARGDST